MFAPIILLAVSLACTTAAVLVPGSSDLLLVAIPMTLGSLWLLLRASYAASRSAPRWIVIDGSNVMHWAGDTPRIEPVREVVKHLERHGFTPGVVFDANAGYLVNGAYMHDEAFSRLLGLPKDRVMVVNKGSVADETILEAAHDMQASVVTNDRYRDWAEQYPAVRTPGFLIQGGYRAGRLWLNLDDQDGDRAETSATRTRSA